MNEKPEALKLAEELEAFARFSGGGGMDVKAAAELRRLHAENERLQNLLYEMLGELTALRAEKQMRDQIAALRGEGA